MRSHLLKNITSTFFRQVLSGFLQIFIISLIANVYGPEGNGIFALSILLPTMLVTFLNFGVGSANIYFISSQKICNKNVLQATLVIFKYQNLLAFFFGILIIFFFKNTVFSEISFVMLILTLLFFPFLLLSNLTSSYFQAIQDFDTYNFLSIIQPVIFLCLILFCHLINAEINYVILSYFISVVLIQIFSLKKIGLASMFTDVVDVSIEKRKILKYGFKSHMSNVLAFINYRADLFIIGYYLEPTQTGIYVVAVTLSETLTLISSSVSTILFPKLSSITGPDEDEKLLASTMSRIVIFLTLIFSLFLLFLLNVILEVAFNDEYSHAYCIIILLIPGIILGSSARILANDFASRGRPDLNMKTSWVAVTCNIVLNFILIPAYGLTGAAIATSVSYTINLILRLYIHQLYTGINFTKNLFLEINDLIELYKIFRLRFFL